MKEAMRNYKAGFNAGKRFMYDYYFKEFKEPVIIEKKDLIMSNIDGRIVGKLSSLTEKIPGGRK